MRTIMRRSGPMMAVVLIAAMLSVPGTAAAQSPSKSQSPKSNVWNGVEEWFADSSNGGVINPVAGGCGTLKYHYTIRFRFVEDPKFGHGAKHRYSSMSINWSGSGRAYTAGYREQTCSLSGGVDVTGAWTKDDEKIWQAKFQCKGKELSNNFVFTCGLPGVTFPHVVPIEQIRDGCSYSEEQPGHRYSVWLSPQMSALMKVTTDKSGPDTKYWNFVPEPGATISFLVRSSIPSLFRFTLDDVSALPGYAMNAWVDDPLRPSDDSFFVLFPSLQHLKGQYRNDSPDLIFDPANYNNRADWKAPSFGAVETAKFSSAATVTVTAMDYGAYGHLHAYFKGICGGWMPVTIKWDKPPASGGQRPPGITIPMDDNGNLIADRMEEKNNGLTQWAYTGDPGADNDDKPASNFAGDGLTTFEEYRGFMVRSGPDCSEPSDVEHIRTDPRVKDIFIHADDPDMEKLVPIFESVSLLAVHRICPQQYLSDGTREVNFTLHAASKEAYRVEDQAITLPRPQHGLHLVNERLPDGTLGHSDYGPPGKVDKIRVDKTQLLRFPNGAVMLARTIFHELGHAIGIYHHGDTNLRGPIVILNCINGHFGPNSGAVAGSVNGKSACKFDAVAVRGGQNSGNQECPMKYIAWKWYIPQSTTLTATGNTVNFRSGSNSEPLPGYVLMNNATNQPASLRSYATPLEHPGILSFSDTKQGTGINALPGDENRAGNATRGSCSTQIHVNDLR
jgi:hypothetical protein